MLTEMQKKMVGDAGRVYDDEALTCDDLQMYWHCGWRKAKEKINAKLKSGEWETVYKKTEGQKDKIAYRTK